jgi:predicted transcriptional regulator
VILRPYPRREIPWHRTKRLAKKWRKQRGPRYLYDKVDVREILHDLRRGILYCYPPMLDALRSMLQE